MHKRESLVHHLYKKDKYPWLKLIYATWPMYAVGVYHILRTAEAPFLRSPEFVFGAFTLYLSVCSLFWGIIYYRTGAIKALCKGRFFLEEPLCGIWMFVFSAVSLYATFRHAALFLAGF